MKEGNIAHGLRVHVYDSRSIPEHFMQIINLSYMVHSEFIVTNLDYSIFFSRTSF